MIDSALSSSPVLDLPKIARAHEMSPGFGRISLFDPNLLILALSGRPVILQRTLHLTEALRGAILRRCPQPIPEWVSGHSADGSRSGKPHLAFVPLPAADAACADGRVVGAALVLPRSLETGEAERCLGALSGSDSERAHPLRLYRGKWLECRATREQRGVPPWNLRAEAWTRQSHEWASVTPVVLDRHSERGNGDNASESMKKACENIGLPRPRTVVLHSVSIIAGVPCAREFPPLFRKTDGGRMQHAHATLVFDEPVAGPILIGAGRFKGYGFFRPSGHCQSRSFA